MTRFWDSSTHKDDVTAVPSGHVRLRRLLRRGCNFLVPDDRLEVDAAHLVRGVRDDIPIQRSNRRMGRVGRQLTVENI
jgi:hypothetical protein